ncbi:hypothetical protein LXT21_37425 [Myxococcus sp. K38C18041901]|uniref:hypothetical protein n=1 Tax=Myxococcus guangdongensis TaxID=2906760 RepID=UPI0020A78730|nr:hypothetical protein [Myxococcus guangdongensis]MCP3064470.1 hypothetical protein [Myxococcus guangdongensis]
MSDEVSRGKAYLRVPLLLVTAVLSMGSGMGNPGCSSGDDDVDVIAPEACESGCAISGAYVFRFQDTTPLSADCGQVGVVLPEGERVVVVQNGREVDIKGTLGEVALTGSHYAVGDTRQLALRAVVELRRREGPPTELLYLIEGEFAEPPASLDAPAAFSGLFHANHVETVEGDPECRVLRRFTATRQ